MFLALKLNSFENKIPLFLMSFFIAFELQLCFYEIIVFAKVKIFA